MELNNSNNYEQDDNLYQSRPNPNDALFGDMNTDQAYVVSSTSTGSSSKKGGSGIVSVIVAILCIAIIGGVVFYIYNSTNKYNGTYQLTKGVANGIELDMEMLASLTGVEISGTIEIKGKKGHMELSMMGETRSGDIKVEIDGTDITLKNGSETLYAKYDEEEDAIVFEEEGAMLYFEKVD